MRRINWKRAGILLVSVTVFGALYLFWFDRPIPIEFYRVLDDRTLAVDVDDGSAWNRVQSVVETDSTVTVTVRSLIVPIPPAPAGLARSAEVVVKLAKPLGNRQVIDGSSAVPLQAGCRPWLAGCPTMPPSP